MSNYYNWGTVEKYQWVKYIGMIRIRIIIKDKIIEDKGGEHLYIRTIQQVTYVEIILMD